MASTNNVNDLAVGFIKDAYCYIPIGMLTQYAKIRPVQSAGVQKLKNLIRTAGYDQNSVIKVRAPAGRVHVHWGVEKRQEQIAGTLPSSTSGSDSPWDEMLSGFVLKRPGEYTEEEKKSLYGVVDGAHRYVGMIDLVDDPLSPGITLDYLVPCTILDKDVPEELINAIATRELIFKIL